MGNEQSVPRQSTHRRPANKLWKPRTNNHSSGISLNPGRSSVQGSRRNSINSAAAGNRLPTLNSESWPTNTEAGARPKGDPPKKKRLSLFRSKGSKKHEEPDVEPEVFQSFGEQGPNEQMLDRYHIQQRSRANSITTSEFHYEVPVQDGRERPAVRERMHRWSTQQIPHQQHNPQPSLVNEFPSTQIPAPEEPMMLRYDSNRTSTGLRSITNSEVGDDEYVVSRYDQKRTSGSGLRSRTNSETTIHGPIRRRSLQQHGVATRPGYSDSHPRQSVPVTRVPSVENIQGQSEQSPERYLYQLSYNNSRNQPHDIQESKGSTPGLVHMLRPTPVLFLQAERTETPTEGDYGHIGAFKLGTLRIVNGTASPTPSEREPSIDGDKDEDILSTKKAHPSESPKSIGKREKSGSAPKSGWTVHTESPLHRSQEPETTILRVDTHLPLPLPDLSFEPFDFKLDLPDVLNRKPGISGGEKGIQTRSVEIKPQESAQDLALSPFSFTHSPPITPQLETTSKHMAIEDSLFDLEPQTPTLRTTTIPRSDSKDSGYGPGIANAARHVKGPRENLRDQTLAKADSGYSSNVSLRSFKKDKKETLAPSNQGSRKDELSRVGSGTAYSFESSTSSETKKLRLQRSLPSLPKQAPKVPSKESLRKVSGPPVSMRKSSGNLMGKKERKVIDNEEKISAIPKVVYEAFSRETSPAISELSATSASTAASTAPSMTSSRWRLGNKLKREPSPSRKTKPEEASQQPFTVQAFRGLSEQLRIPKPSLEVRKHLEKREQEFPVNSFKNTLPLNYNAPPPLATQLRRTASKETLGTIFSVGSMEVREELGFARMHKSLPAVPVEQSIPEDPTSSPTGELFPRGPTKERERVKPDMIQISKNVKGMEQASTEKNDKPSSVEPMATIQAPVKRPPRDWGRRSLAANFREKEAPESPPRKEVGRSLGPTPPQSPPRKPVGTDSQRQPATQVSKLLVARDLVASESTKHELEVEETKRALGRKASFSKPGEAQSAQSTVAEPIPAQKPKNDRQSLPSQLASLPAMPTLVTSRKSLPLSQSGKELASSSPPRKTIVGPTRAAPEIPSAQPRPAPSLGPISTKVSVPALRRLYQGPDPASSMPAPNPKVSPEREEVDVIPTSVPVREPQRQEWRRRSSNASRKQPKSPDSEEMPLDPHVKSTSKADVVQGPTDSHLITSIASYPASDSFKALSTRSSNDNLAPKTLQTKKSQPSIASNSSRRSARPYPPQAHANRGPRSIFSSYQAPPPPGPAIHIGSQLQDQSFYAQIERRQSQEFEPTATSPRAERSANKPPVSMTTQRNSALVKSPSQEYFALRNEDTLITNAASTAATTPTVDPSWEPSRKFWSQRRRSAGNLSQNRRVSMDSVDQSQQSLNPRRSMNLKKPDSSEQVLDSQENSVSYRGRPVENKIETPVRRSSIGFQSQPVGVQRQEISSQEPFERTVTRQSGLRHSQPSENDLRSRRSIDISRPEPSEQELARLSRSDVNRQNSAEKRSRSVGFAPQSWEPAKKDDNGAFVKKRQSMDRVLPDAEPSQPTRKLSIDTLPSQTGQIGLGMRRASPSPVSTPQFGGSRRSFDTAIQHSLQGSRRSFDMSQQPQHIPTPPHTLLQGPRRSFDQGQTTGWTEQQKLAWSAQSNPQPYPPYPSLQSQPREILGANPEFAQNFPTIPKSISTYHAQIPSPTPVPTYYPPSPSAHFYPPPRALRPRSSNPVMSPALSLTSQEEMLILDRYSGGLGYNFEPGLGISGSAGTGSMGGVQGVRKSVGQREMYGVDLSDVPVMLQRVRVEN